MSIKWLTDDKAKKINIYGNKEVISLLNIFIEKMISKSLVQVISDHINLYELSNNETITIANYNINFFDIQTKGNLLYGFETVLHNGKKLIFLGDEKCNPILYDRITGSDYVMHEVYCMDNEKDKFDAIKFNKSTIKTVCETLNPLNIKNLILYHTEDTHPDKKELYTTESNKYFKNNVIIPNDMDEIILN